MDMKNVLQSDGEQARKKWRERKLSKILNKQQKKGTRVLIFIVLVFVVNIFNVDFTPPATAV